MVVERDRKKTIMKILTIKNSSQTLIVRVVLGIFLILLVILLILGEKTFPPSTELDTNRNKVLNFDPRLFPKEASNPNYSVICVNKKNFNQRFVKTGPYSICPSDYVLAPIK